VLILILFVSMIGLLVVMQDTMQDTNEDTAQIWGAIGAIWVLSCITLGFLIMLFKTILLYKLWKVIPPDIARTTPGMAVGLSFIPFFHLYWLFVAYVGLANDMNKSLQQRGIQRQSVSTLGQAICVANIFSFVIPFSVFILFFVIEFISIYFLDGVKNSAIVLLEQGEQ